MRKKILAIALGTVILAPPLLVEAQQQKLYRAGVLMLGRSDIAAMKGLRDGLKEAGYFEGKNLILDAPAIETIDELRPIAKAYIEKKFDVIVASGATAPLIARELTREIPIVFVGASDPVGSGLVKSAARPETAPRSFQQSSAGSNGGENVPPTNNENATDTRLRSSKRTVLVFQSRLAPLLLFLLFSYVSLPLFC
jgi:hypothetical protein